MLWRSLCLIAVGLCQSSCSGWNSELDTAYIDDGKSLAKPLCDFEIKNNCWAQSLSMIQSCAPVVEGEEELLTSDQESCKSSQGKQVNFIDDSLDAFLAYPDQPLHFKVYKGQKPCYEFYGRTGNFTIDSPDYGELSVETLANGDIQVSCFFNEGFLIPKEANSLGCRGQKAAADQVSPRYGLNYKQEKNGSGGVVYDHFQFFFMGAGIRKEPVFSCHH